MKLWLLKLFGRITRQRKSLTLLVIILLIVFYLINKLLSIIFLFFVLTILLIDLFVSISSIKSKTLAIENYLLNGGEEFWAYAGDYFCYVQDGIEFKKVEWSDLYEYCRIKSPKSISFRNKQTKEVHIFYENEFTADKFSDFKEIVDSRVKVIPLV